MGIGYRYEEWKVELVPALEKRDQVSEGREGEEKSSFFMVGDGMLVWSKRREEGA